MGKGIRLAFVLSDLHCGSTLGLLPPGFTTLEGNRLEQNAAQKWLWEGWQDATEKWLPNIAGKDDYCLILNGDLVDGIHHQSTQIVSADMTDQFDAATQCLEPIAKKASKVFLTEGTEVHARNLEHGLAKKLGAIADPDTRKPAWPRLSLTVAGTRCIFQHHISTTSRAWLEASALSIHLANEQIEAARNRETLPKVLCCAHRHIYGEFKNAAGLCVVTPPWQLLTRYAYRVVPSSRCKPGIVALDFRGVADGELPVTHARTYRPPEAKGATI